VNLVCDSSSDAHEILPVPGSARQLDGSPADLTRPLDYPVEAVCSECGQPVRCERWFLGDWYHIEVRHEAPLLTGRG